MAGETERIKPTFFGSREQDAEQILIGQFYTLLKAEYQRVQEDHHAGHPDRHLHDEIERLFMEEKNWDNAYHIEQLLVYLIREEDLDAKISRSLLDIKEILIDRSLFYQEELKEADISTKRSILRNMVQDTQWFYKTRNVKYIYERQIRSRVTWIFIGALILFFLPNIVPHLASFLIEYAGGPRAYFIFVAITSGALGATFSLLTGLRVKFNISGIHDLRTMRRWSYGFLRVFIGMGAGVLFYYFIQTGLIQGDFVPKKFHVGAILPTTSLDIDREKKTLLGTGKVPSPEQEEEMAQATASDQPPEPLEAQGITQVTPEDKLEYKDLALLILLCFISGFSEKLVPDILARTEQRIRAREGAPGTPASGSPPQASAT